MKEISYATVILLIRDSLINYKLVAGLNSLGLDADDYNLYMGDVILSLMGFEKNEETEKIYEEIYLPHAEKVKKIKFSRSTKKLDELSMDIFNELMDAKTRSQQTE